MNIFQFDKCAQIAENHGYRDRPHASRDGSEDGGNFGARWIGVTHDDAALFGSTSVDECDAFFYVLWLNKPRLPCTGDDNIGCLEVFNRAFLQSEHRNVGTIFFQEFGSRYSHQSARTDDDRALPRYFYICAFQDLHDCQGDPCVNNSLSFRTRRVDHFDELRVKCVHISLRWYRGEDRIDVDLFWKW